MPILRLAFTGILLLAISASTAHAQVILERAGLWQFDVRATLRACLSGSCSTSNASDSEQFEVPSGTVVNVGILVGGCAGTVDPSVISQLSEYRTARRGRKKLKITDLKALRALLKGCTGYTRFRLIGMTGRLQQAEDGTSFDSTSRATFTLRVQGHTLNATLVTRVQGQLIEAGGALVQDAPGLPFLNVAPVTQPYLPVD
jgi:hypothetical protein